MVKIVPLRESPELHRDLHDSPVVAVVWPSTMRCKMSTKGTGQELKGGARSPLAAKMARLEKACKSKMRLERERRNA